jgi:hypothetical protein
MLDRKRIGEILMELGVIEPAEVERVLVALRRRGDFAKFGQVAKDMGLIREEHILAALAVQMELFPRAGGIGIDQLLDRLSAPIKSAPQVNVAPMRRKIASQLKKPAY